MTETPSKLNPALAGGAFIAVFSSLPFINMGNCCCCMWVLFGGALSSWLYGRSLPPDADFSGGDGAVPGLLAGVFGALFGSLLNYLLIGLFDFNPARYLVEGLADAGEDIPTGFRDLLAGFESPDTMSSALVITGLFFSLLINAIFATVGGILGASMLRKKRPAPQDRGSD
ncbi:MAG TPA: hypothetical protein ENN17_08675 [bacterium]|nr:hypothetical protein [bacterium]